MSQLSPGIDASSIVANPLVAVERFALLGWPVLPLHNPTPAGPAPCSCGHGPEVKGHKVGKHPRLKRGLSDASTDLGTVRGWWRQWPAANVGVLGGEGRFWGLDVDLGKPGWETLQGWIAEHGPLPRTLTVQTGSGGRHYYWRWPPELTAWLSSRGRALIAHNGYPVVGLDVKQGDGYLVAPPSLHESGRRYEIIDDAEPADAPEWLVLAMTKPPPPPRPAYVPPAVIDTSDRERRFVSQALAGAGIDIVEAPEGARHKTLHAKAVKLGGYIAAGLIDETHVVAELQRAGEATGKDAREVGRTVQAGVAAGKLRPVRPELRAEAGPSSPPTSATRAEVMAWWDANPEMSSRDAAQVWGIAAATLRQWAHRTRVTAPPVTPDPAVTAPPVTPDPAVTAPPVTPDPAVTAPPVTPDPAVTAPPVTPDPAVTAPPVTPDPAVTAPPVTPDPAVTAPPVTPDPAVTAPPVTAGLQHPLAPAPPPPPPPEGGHPPPGDDGDPPEIIISTDIKAVLDASIRCLRLAEWQPLYQRAGMMVQLTRDVSPSGLTWDPDAPVLRPIRHARLREMMATTGAWKKPKATDHGVELVDALPPTWAVEGVLARDEWPFRKAQGVTEIPILRPDGSLHEAVGYDTVTGFIHQPPRRLHLEWPPHALDQELAAFAYERLCEPFQDFPFADPWHQAAAVAFLLSLVARPAIDGPVPLFLFLSTTPKSGKSLLVEVIHLLALGREVARSAPGETEEEMEKRITTIAVAANPCVLFDNLTGTFGGSALDSAVQGRHWQGRILGKTEPVSMQIRTVWTVTGNNLGIKGDLAKRLIPIQLAPMMERPELRDNFAIPNLRAYVREHRNDLLTAAYALLRAHALAGRPSVGTFGGYEEWNVIVRGALTWAGAPDPYKGVAPVVEDADERASQVSALLEVWYATFTSQDVYISDITGHIQAGHHEALVATIKAMVTGRDGQPDLVRLGHILRTAAGRIYGAFRITRSTTKRHGARAWRVQRLGESEPSSPPPPRGG